MPIPSPHEPDFNDRFKFEVYELNKTVSVLNRLRDAHAAYAIHSLRSMHSSRYNAVTLDAVEHIKIVEAINKVCDTIDHRVYQIVSRTITTTSKSTSTTTGTDLFGRTDILHKGT